MPRVSKGWDIQLLGAKSVEKKFKKLARGAQGKIIRPVIREGAKRAKQRVIANLSGDPIAVRTGTTLAAFSAAPVRSGTRRRDFIRIGMMLPKREALNIPEDSPHYYPMALEYGHKNAAARPFIRPAIDNHAEAEKRIMGNEIGRRMALLFRLSK